MMKKLDMSEMIPEEKAVLYRDIVKDGYDVNLYNAEYRDSRTLGADEESVLSLVIQKGDKVLDVGCGSAHPFGRWIVEHGGIYTGIDISSVQIARASTQLPTVDLICDDFLTYTGFGKFDVITAFYSFFHFPEESQKNALIKMKRLLNVGGDILILARTERKIGDYREDWCGAPMVWDHPGMFTLNEYGKSLGLKVDMQRHPENEDYTWFRMTKEVIEEE